MTSEPHYVQRTLAAQILHGEQALGVELDVLVDEAGDEVVAVVVALLQW